MSDNPHRRWHDVRTMLTDWLAWLDETEHWAEATALAEAPISQAEVASGPSPVPASEAVDASEDSASRADLHMLLAAMTALRQEVNLQTRSARQDREQASETLEALSAVVDQFSRETEEEDTSPEVDAVHVDVLLELYDALSRAERQASQIIASTVDTLCDWRTRYEIEHEPVSAARSRAFGRLRGWFGGVTQPVVEPSTAIHESTDHTTTADDASAWVEVGAEAGRMADRLAGLVTGYRFSLQRLERILLTCGIEPIPCLGQAVDPELMEVVQVVSDSTKPPGMVTDEVRCGYRRYGRVYRFAQVVANRSDAAPSHTHVEPATDGQTS